MESQTLKLVSYNCRGVMKSWLDVENLCRKHDVILLQETWLTKQNHSILSFVSPDHFSFAFSPVSDESGIRRGRSYGGIAILWNKALKNVVEVRSSSGSIIGIKISGYDRDLLIINVYLPYCCPDNVDDFMNKLGEINALCEEHSDCSPFILGDFNACTSNNFGPILSEFCEDNGFVLSDYKLLPPDSFTFISDAHGTTSWLDHCMCTNESHAAVKKISILQDFIISDHRPCQAVINCNSRQFEDFDEKLQQNRSSSSRVTWDKVSDEQKFEYFNLTRILMSSILPPLEAIHCKNTNCTNNSHVATTEHYYDQIVDSLLKASTSLSQNKPSNVRKNPVIPNCIGGQVNAKR